MLALKISNHILIDMQFNEVVEKCNSTAIIRDWFTLLLQVYVRQSHVPPQQLNSIKSWLEEGLSELLVNTCVVQSDY